MAVTIAQSLVKVAFDLQEKDATFVASKLWTPTEMIGYYSHAELDFLRQTGILKVDLPVVANPGDGLIYTRPAAIIDIERVAFSKRRLYRASIFDLENENPKFRTGPPHVPTFYHEDQLPVTQFGVDAMVAAGGAFRIFGDKLPAVHTAVTDALVVPDSWEIFIRWEVVALALAKDGDNQDLARSDYAHKRFMVGVSLAKRLISGGLYVALAMAG